ncbi:TOTE conflict system archaeo-eukaryotic primase domain-containing protein [Mycobacterium europaeum]
MWVHLSNYDRLFPSQDVHTGRGVGKSISAPMNGNARACCSVSRRS